MEKRAAFCIGMGGQLIGNLAAIDAFAANA